jgi:hypothetical protein
LVILQGGSPTISRISQQVLLTEVTATAQSVFMAWRAAVICRERQREREGLIVNVVVFVVRTGWGEVYYRDLMWGSSKLQL